MILIAESGSTKTDWVVLETGENFSTNGYNGTLQTSAFIQQDLATNVGLVAIGAQVTKVYFYGAGTSAIGAKERVMTAFCSVFTNAEILVKRDVYACAYAVYEGEPVVSCILGTGSNSSLFDGEKLLDKTDSMGYILGDEGSGGYIGKQLLRKYIYKQIPQEAIDYLDTNYDLSKVALLENVNRNPKANVYLASFAKEAKALIHFPEVREIVVSAFDEFIKIHVLTYYKEGSPSVGFIGSVAFHFQDILKEVALKNNIKIGSILQKPIDGLVEYHRHLSL